MSTPDAWMRFSIAVLTTWRVTHLLANEDGPAGILARFRARLGDGLAGQLMDCFQCLSLWVALPVGMSFCRAPRDRLMVGLALSGAACLLERTVRDPLVIQPLPSAAEGELDRGMLRSTTPDAQDQSATRVDNTVAAAAL